METSHLSPSVQQLAVLLRALQTLQASCGPRDRAQCGLTIMSTKKQPGRAVGEAAS